MKHVMLYKYSTFNIGDSTTNYIYTITVGGYSCDAGDSMTISGHGYVNGMKFSTKDRDNDVVSTNCGLELGGTYNECYCSHLNGPYVQGSNRGMHWVSWHYSSLTFTEMKLKSN